MTLSVRSPEDVVNLSLSRIGYPMRIVNIMDGTRASMAALNIYSQTRDELLRVNDWAFAQRNVLLTLLKSAPATYIPPTAWSTAYPPLPWLYEYAYPADCLKVRAVKYQPLFVPNFDPQPNLFGIENDNSLVPPAKVILSNVPSAVLVYTGQVTDPTTWEADFIEAVAAAIGRRLAPVLVNLNATQLAAQDEAVSTMVAEREQG